MTLCSITQAFADNLIEARIKLQKALTAASSLPQVSIRCNLEKGQITDLSTSFVAQAQAAEPYYAALPEEVSSTLAAVAALSETLFTLRETLLSEADQITPLAPSFGAARKRKHSSQDISSAEYVKASAADLASLEQAMEPFLRSTVTKWSDKVLAASGLSLTRDQKKFKAVNQNTMNSIDHALGAGERERLLKRTRVRRGNEAVVGQQVLHGEESRIDEECFDDADFYGQMLRDLVESRMLDLGTFKTRLFDHGAQQCRRLTLELECRRPYHGQPATGLGTRQEAEEGRRHSGE